MTIAIEERDEADNQSEDDLVAPLDHTEQRSATQEAQEAEQSRNIAQNKEKQWDVAEISLCVAKQDPDAGCKISQRLDERIVTVLRLVVESGNDREMKEIVLDPEDKPGMKKRQRGRDGSDH